MADFFNAPVVDEVDLSSYSGVARGDIIAIRDHDDFKVWHLLVTISDANGQEIKSGEAEETPHNGGRWVYTTSTIPHGHTVRIAVMAPDQSGGIGEVSEEKSF